MSINNNPGGGPLDGDWTQHPDIVEYAHPDEATGNFDPFDVDDPNNPDSIIAQDLRAALPPSEREVREAAEYQDWLDNHKDDPLPPELDSSKLVEGKPWGMPQDGIQDPNDPRDDERLAKDAQDDLLALEAAKRGITHPDAVEEFKGNRRRLELWKQFSAFPQADDKPRIVEKPEDHDQ